MGKVAAIGRDGRFMVNPSNHSESTTHYSKSYISEGVPVTDGLKVWLDADDWASYPGTKTMLGDWNDYGSNQDHYRTMGSDGVVLLGTSTNWIGRFIATTTATGNHTLVFDYWSDSSSSSFVLNDSSSVLRVFLSEITSFNLEIGTLFSSLVSGSCFTSVSMVFSSDIFTS